MTARSRRRCARHSGTAAEGCVSAVVLAQPRQCLGRGVAAWPLFPSAYKYPPWGSTEEIFRTLEIVSLFLRFLVVLCFLLLLVSLAIRVKDRECVKVIFEG